MAGRVDKVKNVRDGHTYVVSTVQYPDGIYETAILPGGLGGLKALWRNEPIGICRALTEEGSVRVHLEAYYLAKFDDLSKFGHRFRDNAFNWGLPIFVDVWREWLFITGPSQSDVDELLRAAEVFKTLALSDSGQSPDIMCQRFAQELTELAEEIRHHFHR